MGRKEFQLGYLNAMLRMGKVRYSSLYFCRRRRKLGFDIQGEDDGGGIISTGDFVLLGRSEIYVGGYGHSTCQRVFDPCH